MKTHSVRLLAAAICATGLLAAAEAKAVDGVLEINDTTVTAAGGYPFAIVATGSYVLTGDLASGPANGLVVVAPNVVLDMNGFSLTGGGATGIDAAGAPGFKVENGAIQGFTGDGLIAGPETQVYKMRISGNGGNGITSAFECLVVESVFVANGGVGIIGDRCKIENNVITQHPGAGIVGADNVIAHNEIAQNGAGGAGGGILANGGCTIQQNAILANTGFGIADAIAPGPAPAPPLIPFPVLPGPVPSSNIRGNTITGATVGFGIFLNGKALISDNVVTDNALDGIVCQIACQVSGNQVGSNNGLALSNGGLTIGPGSTVNGNSISFNTGIGLAIDPTASYLNNTLNANTAQDMSIVVPAAPAAPHPTSGFMNLCTGVVGPFAGLCP